MNKYVIEENKVQKNYYLVCADSRAEAVEKTRQFIVTENEIRKTKSKIKGLNNMLSGIAEGCLETFFPGKNKRAIDNESYRLYDDENHMVYEFSRTAESDEKITKRIKNKLNRIIFMS